MKERRRGAHFIFRPRATNSLSRGVRAARPARVRARGQLPMSESGEEEWSSEGESSEEGILVRGRRGRGGTQEGRPQEVERMTAEKRAAVVT